MRISLLGSQIIGSPITAVVYPGEIKSAICTSTVSSAEILQFRAGITYFFTITFVDVYGNIHFQTMTDDMLNVSIMANYVNHDEWPSAISIPDAADWQAVYGTNIAGIAIENNDGTMTG